MKRVVVTGLVLACAALVVVVWWRVGGASETRPASTDLAAQLEQVKADLAALTEKHQSLRKEFDQMKVDFRRHSHPVRFWDNKGGRSTPWVEKGTFFIAYPKVGAGDSDSDAVQAGGVWGTP